MIDRRGFTDDQAYATFDAPPIVACQLGAWCPVASPAALHAWHYEAVRQRKRAQPEWGKELG
jgi:hypothetical protein